MAAYQTKEFTYASSDGKNNIAAYLYTPTEKTPVRAIVQIIHDMRDYVGRYTDLVAALCGAGYAVCGNDHLGHGRTARHSDDLGFFTDEDGTDTLITDAHKLTLLMRSQFKGAPVILLGQGMGSYLARLYTVNYYRDIEGVILLATGNDPLAVAWRIMANIVAHRYGGDYRSPLLARMTFGRHNRQTGGSPDGYEWLTRDDEKVAAYTVDPYCNFAFTASAYADLYSMIERASSSGWSKKYPKSLPTLIAAGEADPAGRYGKGPAAVYDRLQAVGVKDVTLKLYEGARHELHNETCRTVFENDLLAWLNERY